MATAPLIYTTEAKRNEEMDAMRKRHETAVDELFEKYGYPPGGVNRNMLKRKLCSTRY